jgi:NADH-quinone oxidoreductase subunit E
MGLDAGENMLAEKYVDEIATILNKYPPDQKRSAVMPLLYLAQSEQGYVTRQSFTEIAEILEISPTEVASIVGFYSLYYDKPGGKYRFQVCNDLPCALRGADEFIEKLCENLGIKVGETTRDLAFSLEVVRCVGACGLAPVMFVDNDVHAMLQPEKIDAILDRY